MTVYARLHVGFAGLEGTTASKNDIIWNNRAIFTEGATVTELAENKSGSIAKAHANAVAFTQAVLDYLVHGYPMSLFFAN